EENDSASLGLNFNDPHSWPNMTDKLRCCLVEHEPEQWKDADFTLSTSSDERRFSRDWLIKILPNGETVERKWLMYSETQRAVFCFPCMLFGKKSPSTPNIANPKRGFSDWKHLSPRIGEHENSPEHRQSYLSWRSFEMNIKHGTGIDSGLQRTLTEKEKWRTILKIILDAVIFCIKDNLALRGSSDIIGQSNSGIFLKLLEMISHYNPELAVHISNHKKGRVSYFSPAIQNEFINLLGNTVRQELISRIKETKYYSAGSSVDMVSFFGTVQRLFNFFVSSTSRWEILTNILKITLKGHSDTRWSSKARAIKSLSRQLPGVLQALQEISEQTSCPETVSTAESLMLQINFKFICTLLMWDRILSNIDCVSQALQTKGLSVDQAAKLINGLRRDEGVDAIMKDAANHAQSMDLSSEFPKKRNRKVRRLDSDEAQDEGFNITAEQAFKIQFNNVIDALNAQLQWRYETLSEISSDFEFLTGPALSNMPLSQIKKCATDLAMKYPKDLHATEIVTEIASFKFQAVAILPDCCTATPQALLNLIHQWCLSAAYPSIEIALRIFLTLPVTVAPCERSFSKLKLVKNYLRSSIGQQRLSNLAILSIEHTLTSLINFDAVIDEFASVKARRAPL
uniref:HAT C-terminal dimerisation domain-containing protein n=1 Tax=Latimeria chalumnae TaxID=7897 RepID=H3B153_LATCH